MQRTVWQINWQDCPQKNRPKCKAKAYIQLHWKHFLQLSQHNKTLTCHNSHCLHENCEKRQDIIEMRLSKNQIEQFYISYQTAPSGLPLNICSIKNFQSAWPRCCILLNAVSFLESSSEKLHRGKTFYKPVKWILAFLIEKCWAFAQSRMSKVFYHLVKSCPMLLSLVELMFWCLITAKNFTENYSCL